MIVNFFSPDGRYDDIYLSNFATIYVKDELLRVDGVSDINYLGQRDYSIRAWLDPQKLASRNMTAMDVANAIRNQNLDAPAGQIGQPPRLAASRFSCRSTPSAGSATRSSSAPSSSRSAPEFGRAMQPALSACATSPASSWASELQPVLHLRRPSVRGTSIYQLPGTNALDVADRVRAKMEELKLAFPTAWITTSATTPRRTSANRSTTCSNPAGSRRPGRPRGAGFPAGLAGHDPADDRRARLHHRHLRRHGCSGLSA